MPSGSLQRGRLALARWLCSASTAPPGPAARPSREARPTPACLSGARRIECGNRGLAARQGAPLIALEPGELLGKVGDDQCKFQRALRPPERGLAHVVRHRDAADQQLADCDQHRDLPPQIAGRTIARVVERAGHHGVTGAPHPHEVNLRLRDRPGEIGKLGADADAGGAIADGARDPRDLLGQQRIVRGRNVEAMAERVLARDCRVSPGSCP